MKQKRTKSEPEVTRPWKGEPLRYAGHRATYEHDGFTLAVYVHGDPTPDDAGNTGNVGVIVLAHKYGVELGSSSLWGIDTLYVPENYDAIIVRDLAADAVSEARKKLAAIVKAEEASVSCCSDGRCPSCDPGRL